MLKYKGNDRVKLEGIVTDFFLNALVGIYKNACYVTLVGPTKEFKKRSVTIYIRVLFGHFPYTYFDIFSINVDN